MYLLAFAFCLIFVYHLCIFNYFHQTYESYMLPCYMQIWKLYVALKFPVIEFDEKTSGDWSHGIPQILYLFIPQFQTYLISRKQNASPKLRNKNFEYLMNYQSVNVTSHSLIFNLMNGNFSETKYTTYQTTEHIEPTFIYRDMRQPSCILEVTPSIG